MIKRLKKKLIILATAAMFILMALLVSIMNIINYSSVVNGTDMIINVLLQSDLPFDNKPNIPVKPARDFKGFIPRGMSPEVPYESRYFTVLS